MQHFAEFVVQCFIILLILSNRIYCDCTATEGGWRIGVEGYLCEL